MKLASSAEYQSTFGHNITMVEKFQHGIRMIVEVYGEIHKQGTNFNYCILPSIVGLATSLYSYAKDFIRECPEIYERLVALDDTSKLPRLVDDSTKIREQQSYIYAMVGRDMTFIEKIFRAAEKIAEDLENFATSSKANQAKLCDIMHKTNTIGLCQNEMVSWQNIIDHANLTLTSLELIRELILHAIRTMKSLQGSFHSIACNLQRVQEQATQNCHSAKSILAEQSNVVESWEALGKRINQYIRIAYLVPSDSLNNEPPIARQKKYLSQMLKSLLSFKITRERTTIKAKVTESLIYPHWWNSSPYSDEFVLAHTRPSPPPSLPAELYGRIFEFITDSKDLLSLCTVSRNFYHEAEHVLYGYIDLSDNHLTIITWFHKITSDIRLAGLVRSLTFGIIAADMPTDPHPWLKMISLGLRVLVNLKELHLRKRSFRFIDGMYAQLLWGHPFRLKVFRNEMFDLEPTLPFLASQPDITLWDQRNATPCEIPDGLLPHLTDAALDSWILSKLSVRSIRRLATRIACENAADERSLLETLNIHMQHLLILELEREVNGGCLSMGDFIRLLAQKSPFLESFSFQNRGESEAKSTIQEFGPHLSTLCHLTTLTLLPSRCSGRSLYWALLSGNGRLEAASTLFRSVPSLKRISFPNVRGNDVWYARSERYSMTGDTVVGESDCTADTHEGWISVVWAPGSQLFYVS